MLVVCAPLSPRFCMELCLYLPQCIDSIDTSFVYRLIMSLATQLMLSMQETKPSVECLSVPLMCICFTIISGPPQFSDSIQSLFSVVVVITV